MEQKNVHECERNYGIWKIRIVQGSWGSAEETGSMLD